MKRVLTAVNHPIINQYLKDNHPEFDVFHSDLESQDMLIGVLKQARPDVIVLNESLPGSLDRYALIEKIQQINRCIKIVIIVSSQDKEYQDFLVSKGVSDILVNDKAEIIDLIDAIKRDFKSTFKTPQEIPREVRNEIKTLKKLLSEKPKIIEKKIILESPPKIQRQEIIVAAGAGGVGKSDFITQLSVTLAKKTSAKILVIDLNTEFPSQDLFFGIPREPQAVDYFIGNDKNSSLNYLIDNIDKGRLDSNTFEELVVKYKPLDNLHIVTGSTSLYFCQHVLNADYYKAIIEKAKALYDFIFIDTSSNIFLDSTQFSITHASRIYFLLEGSYSNLRKSLQILDLYIKNWNVDKNRIQIIVNNYSDASLDKAVVKEIFAEYDICQFINHSHRHQLFLNKNVPFALKASDKELEPYLNILAQLNFIEKRSLFKKLFSSQTYKINESKTKYYETTNINEGI